MWKATQPDGLAKWSSLGLHANHLKRVNEFQTPQGQAQFEQLVQQVRQHTDFILTPDDSGYPTQLLPYTDYPPIILGKVKRKLYCNLKLRLSVAESQAHMDDRSLMILPIT